MSSKYVPPALRNSNTTSASNAKNAARSTTVHHDSVSPSVVHDSVKPPSLVNTSLPAKEAPKLVPATLASLTGDVSSMNSAFKDMNLEKVSIYNGNHKKVNLTEDDFPTLGRSLTQSAVKPAMNFAEKAREWAVKQKEDARIAAEEAEKERIRTNTERMLREKEEKEAKIYKKTIISIPSVKRTNEMERYNDKNDELSDYEEEPYESPLEEEEEEEAHDEYHSHWDGRRYRDEY
jgi:hypothetical protein